MQLELMFDRPPASPTAESLLVRGQPVRLHFVRHRRARRYILRLAADGSVRITVPRRGSLAEARRFADNNLCWLEKQLALRAARRDAVGWTAGTVLLFRGQEVALQTALDAQGRGVRWADEICVVKNPGVDLRPAVEAHLWNLAGRELPARTFELAALHGLSVRHVTVRNQRSRWGSCSSKGVISLNWRLVQTPPAVSDYIILHELAHLKVPNHSRRFWREVERLCPEFADAERWIRRNSQRVFSP